MAISSRENKTLEFVGTPVDVAKGVDVNVDVASCDARLYMLAWRWRRAGGWCRRGPYNLLKNGQGTFRLGALDTWDYVEGLPIHAVIT